jgi:hypothetical protein
MMLAMRIRSLAVPLAAAVGLAVAACEGDPGTPSLPDAAPDALACPSPREILPAGWTPVAKVSAGAVSSASAGGVTTTSVDATAGGFGGSGSEPFVYVSFAGGAAAKASIDDPASFDSDAWDLAFKRYVIRSNGGDSGTGGVAVAIQLVGELDQVTSVPQAAEFEADEWMDGDCQLVTDPLGAPTTVFSDWYAIADTVLTPQPRVHVVRLRDGAHIKLRITSYYGDGDDPSGNFRLDWAPL